MSSSAVRPRRRGRGDDEPSSRVRPRRRRRRRYSRVSLHPSIRVRRRPSHPHARHQRRPLLRGESHHPRRRPATTRSGRRPRTDDRGEEIERSRRRRVGVCRGAQGGSFTRRRRPGPCAPPRPAPHSATTDCGDPRRCRARSRPRKRRRA